MTENGLNENVNKQEMVKTNRKTNRFELLHREINNRSP